MYFNIYNQSINNLHVLGYVRYKLDLHLALEYPIYTGVRFRYSAICSDRVSYF